MFNLKFMYGTRVFETGYLRGILGTCDFLAPCRIAGRYKDGRSLDIQYLDGVTGKSSMASMICSQLQMDFVIYLFLFYQNNYKNLPTWSNSSFTKFSGAKGTSLLTSLSARNKYYANFFKNKKNKDTTLSKVFLLFTNKTKQITNSVNSWLISCLQND